MRLQTIESTLDYVLISGRLPTGDTVPLFGWVFLVSRGTTVRVNELNGQPNKYLNKTRLDSDRPAYPCSCRVHYPRGSALLSLWLRNDVGKDCTEEDFVIVTERVLIMRENMDPDIAKLIATIAVERSLDIRDVVKFRRVLQGQTTEEVNNVGRLFGQNKMSVFRHE